MTFQDISKARFSERLADKHAYISFFRLSVERNRNLAGGNSKRRWHGTVRACKLGDDGSQQTLCTNQRCSLCRIIEVRFCIRFWTLHDIYCALTYPSDVFPVDGVWKTDEFRTLWAGYLYVGYFVKGTVCNVWASILLTVVTRRTIMFAS